MEGVVDRLLLFAGGANHPVIDRSGKASCRWATDGTCAEVDVPGEFGESGSFPRVVVVAKAVAQGFLDLLEYGFLAFGCNLEASPFCVCSDLVAQCRYDLKDIALAVFERYADCQVDAPEGVFMGNCPFSWADTEEVVHAGQLGYR